MIRIGYACINTRLPSASRTCRLKNATPEKILSLSRNNLQALHKILHWNKANRISMFRISSETIPFASHPVNGLCWWDALKPELESLGRFIKKNRMRVSMHPGQYTVLNAIRARVVEDSVAELAYHARFLDALGVNTSHKIVLHIGGAYGDKSESMKRFARNFSRLSPSVKRRLAVENDEKSYTAEDVFKISRRLKIPMIFDIFHHACNPSFEGNTTGEIIEKVAGTWRKSDGIPKVHYSDQDRSKPAGAHSQTVDIRRFKRFYESIHSMTLDVMIEVKDKEGSVLKIYRELPEIQGP